MLVSDNGASPEGGPTGTTNEMQFFNNAPEPLEDSVKAIDELGGPTAFNHYPWGWTWAGNTPFRRWKRETYRGGTTDPFIVHWPAGIKSRGEVRDHYAHIIDMVPTILDALGIEPPATIRGVTQAPIHGVSFLHTFDDAAAATLHRTQYFEMFGHRAIDHDGWRAVCPWPGPSFAEAGGVVFGTPITAEMLGRLDSDGWELYNVADGPGRDPQPGRRAPRQADRADLAVVRAGRQVQRAADRRQRAPAHDGRASARSPRHATSTRSGPAPRRCRSSPDRKVLNRPHAITADATIPAGGAEGVLLSSGTAVGGWSFYMKDGRLHYVHNYVRRAMHGVSAPDPVPEGRHELRFEFEPTGAPDIPNGKGAPGLAQLYVDGDAGGRDTTSRSPSRSSSPRAA